MFADRAMLLRNVVAALLLCFTSCIEDDLRVTTTSGILLGRRETILGQQMKMFLGVPYATAPVGELRFKHPVPFNSESIERDAKEFAATCYQPPHSKDVINPLLKVNETQISEDCLFLNVYVPDDHEEKSFPVMVWLAGEGFNYADASQFDGTFLAIVGKVIIITINYRVGPFGFLSVLNDDAPGNAGLFDQRAALKWIQLNVENFGGDPNRVTLFGRFTGAMSAAIHALSPKSKSEILFQNVILQSGVPAGDWIFERNPLNSTMELAQVTGCTHATLDEVVSCLKSLPAEDLLKAALPIPGAWRPVLDFNLIYEHSLKAAGKFNYNPVNFIIGFNKDEGSLCLSALQAMKSEHFEKILQNTLTKEDFNILINNLLFDVYRSNNELVKILTAFQYHDYDVAALRDNFIKFCGDIYIKSNAVRLADVLSSINRTVYVYELDHRPFFSKQPTFLNASHGDDVLYSFALPLSMTSLPEEEIALTQHIVKSISNFAYHGNPNSVKKTVWGKYSPESRFVHIFSINKEEGGFLKLSKETVMFFHDVIPKLWETHSCPPPAVVSAVTDTREV